MLGKITKVEVQKRNASRYNVYLDDAYFGSVDQVVWTRAKLQVGMMLQEAVWEEIQSLHEARVAFDKALDTLSAKPATQAEIERKLQQKDFSPEAIANAVEKLLHYGYLNDTAYAQQYVRERGVSKGEGRGRMRQALLQKGIDRAVVEEALTAYPDEQEHAGAVLFYQSLQRRYANSAADNPKRRQKIIAAMQRKGYRWDTIRAVIQSEEAAEDYAGESDLF